MSRQEVSIDHMSVQQFVSGYGPSPDRVLLGDDMLAHRADTWRERDEPHWRIGKDGVWQTGHRTVTEWSATYGCGQTGIADGPETYAFANVEAFPRPMRCPGCFGRRTKRTRR
jgi:hypothetical protein